MTMTMGDPITRQPDQPQRERKPRHSLSAMPTHLIELSPAFLEALKRVAPKHRRPKLPYVAALLVAAAICVAVVPAARQRVVGLAQGVLRRALPAAPASVDPSPPISPQGAATTAAVPPLDPVVVAPSLVRDDTASAAPSTTTAAAAPSAKTTKPSRAPWNTHRRAPR
jgi:hypothetical protein